MVDNHFDIIIIGFSVTGGVAALNSREPNLRVAIIEKDLFPRRKACGEGLSALGFEILKSLNIKLDSSDYEKFDAFNIHYNNIRNKKISNSYLNLNLPLNECKGMGISRENLDRIFLNEIQKSKTVKTYFNTEVKKIIAGDDSVQLNLKINNSNEQVLTTKFVILADGNNSKLIHQINIKQKKKIFSFLLGDRYGYSTSFNGEFQTNEPNVYSSNPTGVSILIENQYEVYLTKVSEKNVNFSIVGDKSIFKTNYHKIILDNSKKLLELIGLKNGEIVSTPKGSGHFSKKSSKQFHKNILLAGDVLTTFDPIGGVGMTFGMLSGIHSSNTIKSILKATNLENNNKLDLKREKYLKTLEKRAFKNYSKKMKHFSLYFEILTLSSFVTLKYFTKFRLLRAILSSNISAHAIKIIYKKIEKISSKN